MRPLGRFRYAAGIVLVTLVSACTGSGPAPGPSTTGSSTGAGTSSTTSSTPPATPTTGTGTPSPTPPATFPLAVVTGITNLKATITVAELRQLAARGALVTPCGVKVTAPALPAPASCVPADEIAAKLRSKQERIALLPAGLVEPATKVLSIRGKGPFGMFGPDLFGDRPARELDYPVMATAAAGGPVLEPSWTAYDASKVWTMTNIGSLCSDRGAAYQAVRAGLGWKYVFNGGTARYGSKPPVDPPDHEPFTSVQPIDDGNDGATPRVLRQSDVAIADHECPVVADADYDPQYGTTAVFSVPEKVLPYWRDLLGIDMAYLAANHMSDQGVAGIRSTRRLLDKHRIPYTGLGLTLDQALKPAYVEVAGLKVGFVAFNDVAGVAEARANTPGVPWINEANIRAGVRRAKAGGADLVICNPQWWGGAEYHDDLWPLQKKQLGWFDKAGCDHVIGSGTHVAGPVLVRDRGDDASVVLVSPGNFAFGQNWWQEVQEGVILDLTFRGTTLVNVRLRPTVMIRQARPALLDPQGDGRYVLQRVWKYSEVGVRP